MFFNVHGPKLTLCFSLLESFELAKSMLMAGAILVDRKKEREIEECSSQRRASSVWAESGSHSPIYRSSLALQSHESRARLGFPHSLASGWGGLNNGRGINYFMLNWPYGPKQRDWTFAIAIAHPKNKQVVTLAFITWETSPWLINCLQMGSGHGVWLTRQHCTSTRYTIPRKKTCMIGW